MLGNNEEILGIDLADMFSRMLSDLPWASLSLYVQANAQIAKVCTAGGHRLNPKRRKRVEKILIREAEKCSYSQTLCNGVFAVWYPVHKELHQVLEDHFNGEEYKAYREEKDLGEDVYVLTEEKFQEFFKIEDLDKWRILLCFSPLQFTQEQADQLQSNSQGNSELLERIAELEEQVAQLEKTNEQLELNAKRIQEEAQKRNSETSETKRQARQLRAEVEAVNKKLEISQADNRRLREESSDLGAQNEELTDKFEVALEKQAGSLRRDLERLQEELVEWQAKYEEQRVCNRKIEEGSTLAKKEKLFADQRASLAEAETQRLTQFADLILGRIEWPKVGAQMKLTPTLRRQFNSLIRKLNYEDDRSLSLEGTLPEFWKGLMGLEDELVTHIAESNSLEVMSGDISEFWLALTDAFGDVRISLEARLVLLNMLQEIFYQVLDMGDLEDPTIPGK